MVSESDLPAVYDRTDDEIAEEIREQVLLGETTAARGAVRHRFEYPEPGPDVFDVVANFAAD